MEISKLSSHELINMLKDLNGIDYTFDKEIPENALYGLHAVGISLHSSPQIEWLIKNSSGILLVSSPITRQEYWSIPEDIQLSDAELHEAEEQLNGDYSYYIESIEQAVYLANQRNNSINLKLERGPEPRLYAFLSQMRDEDYLVNTVQAFEELLPELLLTA